MSASFSVHQGRCASRDRRSYYLSCHVRNGGRILGSICLRLHGFTANDRMIFLPYHSSFSPSQEILTLYAVLLDLDPFPVYCRWSDARFSEPNRL